MSEDPKPYEGIVVLGMPRSGTTLMRRLLNSHPAIHCPPETNLLNAASRFLFSEPSTNGILGGPFGGMESAPYSRDQLADRLREFVFTFFREMADQASKRRWAEKSAYDIFHLDNLQKICGGHCRFLCLFRHPLDVVCSLSELSQTLDRYMSELRPYIARFPRPKEAIAHAWVDANCHLLEFIDANPGSCFKIVYEQLVAKPQHILGDVFDFLDEPADPADVIRRTFTSVESPGMGDWKTFQTTGINRESVGRWKQLSDEDIHRLVAIVEPTMRAIGYEPVESKPVVASDEQRRYELSQIVAQMMKPGPSESGQDS